MIESFLTACMSDVSRLIESESRRAHLVQMIYERSGFERLDAIRNFYILAGPEIISAGSTEWGVDPYEVDWLNVFTPIEAALWHDIRAEDLVMYPQFPVGGYFVDFGNPCAKVAVECDGEAFHKDCQKDALRQARIESLGWSVYRISGRDCKTDFDESTMESGAARKFIKEIRISHGVSRFDRQTRAASYNSDDF